MVGLLVRDPVRVVRNGFSHFFIAIELVSCDGHASLAYDLTETRVVCWKNCDVKGRNGTEQSDGCGQDAQIFLLCNEEGQLATVYEHRACHRKFNNNARSRKRDCLPCDGTSLTLHRSRWLTLLRQKLCGREALGQRWALKDRVPIQSRVEVALINQEQRNQCHLLHLSKALRLTASRFLGPSSVVARNCF